MANELKEKHQRLKKVRTRNIVLNSICILLAGSGIWWTANYFWRYINYEVTNDAFVDQYIAPLNIRASGYIKEVRFKEHQYVHQGDTLLILNDREYRIKVKEAEAALIDAQGSQDVLRSGIETSHTNIAVQDANIAEAKAKLWQLEQDYHRFERLLKEESVPSNNTSNPKPLSRRRKPDIRRWWNKRKPLSPNSTKPARRQQEPRRRSYEKKRIWI